VSRRVAFGLSTNSQSTRGKWVGTVKEDPHGFSISFRRRFLRLRATGMPWAGVERFLNWLYAVLDLDINAARIVVLLALPRSIQVQSHAAQRTWTQRGSAKLPQEHRFLGHADIPDTLKLYTVAHGHKVGPAGPAGAAGSIQVLGVECSGLESNRVESSRFLVSCLLSAGMGGGKPPRRQATLWMVAARCGAMLHATRLCFTSPPRPILSFSSLSSSPFVALILVLVFIDSLRSRPRPHPHPRYTLVLVLILVTPSSSSQLRS
jgi:hypothetical protein